MAIMEVIGLVKHILLQRMGFLGWTELVLTSLFEQTLLSLIGLLRKTELVLIDL